MGERHSEYEREENDWYVEPAWAVEALFAKVNFVGRIHDPCCGGGTIPITARNMGYQASGTDKVVRNKIFAQQDFLKDHRVFHNIVTNPPYAKAQEIIEHALKHTIGRVAVLTQLKFLASQGRYPMFNDKRMEKVLIFSRRPSMPTGQMLEEHGEKIRGNGSIDYCWLIWNHSKTRRIVTTEWII
jgi:tRNA G10  N-methylase Trm11